MIWKFSCNCICWVLQQREDDEFFWVSGKFSSCVPGRLGVLSIKRMSLFCAESVLVHNRKKYIHDIRRNIQHIKENEGIWT